MQYHYHGTTGDNAVSIMRHGFTSDGISVSHIWHSSCPDTTYFYKDTIDGNENEGFYRAIESAQIAAAATNYQKHDLAVVIIVTPDDYLFDDDSSCNGSMSDCAVEINTRKLNELISGGIIELYVEFIKLGYCPGFRFNYLSDIIKNEFFNTDLFTVEEDIFLEGFSMDNFTERYVFEWARDNELPKFIQRMEG